MDDLLVLGDRETEVTEGCCNAELRYSLLSTSHHLNSVFQTNVPMSSFKYDFFYLHGVNKLAESLSQLFSPSVLTQGLPL